MEAYCHHCPLFDMHVDNATLGRPALLSSHLHPSSSRHHQILLLWWLQGLECDVQGIGGRLLGFGI